MYEFHLGRDKAEKHVLALCQKLGITVERRATLRKEITIQAGTECIKVDLAREVEVSRKSGRADVLQSLHDSEDRYLNPPLSMGVIGTGGGVTMVSNYGSHTAALDGDGYIEAPEISFSDELSLYRREAVLNFNSGDLVGFCRNYRAYLQSSVSLVE